MACELADGQTAEISDDGTALRAEGLNNEAGRQKNKAGCYLYFLTPPPGGSGSAMGCAAGHSKVSHLGGALPSQGGVPGPGWYWPDARGGA